MGILDKAIANSVPVIPQPVVRRISRRYIAGDTLEEAVATVRDLNEKGCVATIGRRRPDAAGLREGHRRA